jgi:hypothetical protein
MANKPKILWHYTKLGVLEKIFPPKENHKEYKKGEIKLRFANCRSKNDPSESLVLWDILAKNEKSIIKKYGCPKEIFYKRIKMPENYSWNSYMFSMSCLEDSFAFWNKEYAGVNGVAIGFNKGYFEDSTREKFGRDMFHNVDYDESIENIHKSVDSLYEGNKANFDSLSEKFYSKLPPKILALEHLLNYYSGVYKLKSWEYEREVRIIFIENKYSEAYDSKNLKPIIEFEESKVTKSHYEYFDKNIVDSIMLGPDCNNEQVNFVRDYLKNNGYIKKDDIKVSKSNAISLRYNPNTSNEIFDAILKMTGSEDDIIFEPNPQKKLKPNMSVARILKPYAEE